MKELETHSTTPFTCDFYDKQVCDPTNEICPQRQVCEHQQGMATACHAVWSNDTVNGVKVLNKGCWLAQNQTPNDCNFAECITNHPSYKSGVPGQEQAAYFCCCNRPECNERFALIRPPKPTEAPKALGTSEDAGSVVVIVLVPIVLVALAGIVCYYLYRRFKARRDRKCASLDHEPNVFSLPEISHKSIELEEEIARGRYGTVKKARISGSQLVAVKIFPQQDFSSWSQERDIYTTPGLSNHPNILRYIGCDAVLDRSEYWLVTAYQENGSLHDYLKNHTLTLPEFLRISTGTLGGIAFLHEDSNIAFDHQRKPAIVHRDIKSRNVLLNRDLTACISDFGLAMKCPNGQIPNDVHSQVGTRRYMSPEVLEGATNFTALAFRQIDIYATSLVLWESLSRCSCNGESVDDYKLPYEEVGPKPTVEQLQKHVVTDKRRPDIKPLWKEHLQGRIICATIQEMWEYEADARISAGVALERFRALQDTKLPVLSVVTENGAKDKTDAEQSPLISHQ